MHLLPQLRQVERAFPKELVVIGIHTPKFPNEADDESLRQAIRRYNVTHPVINDADRRIWQEYGVRAWPTLVLIDPDGRIIGAHEGELMAADLIAYLKPLIEDARRRGRLSEVPLDFQMEKESNGALSFPGKVIADPQTRTLFVSDSGHHRVLQIGRDGQIKRVIGSGEEGLRDGPFEKAAFQSPQGLALDPKGRLFIADTGNHAIRLADFQTQTVQTIAGTGQLGRFFSQGGRPLTVALRSPWDLALVGNQLYIAMAGSHQLWVLDLERNWLSPFAGTGAEGIRDGRAHDAHLAQPSGLAVGVGRLFFVDSETSSVRFAELKEPFWIRTIVGRGLFVFGDRDGTGDQVLLQHPLGIAFHNGLLYIADAYNHKIKTVDPRTRTVKTLAGTGSAGFQDGSFDSALFNEPSGLTFLDSEIFVADTNNHSVRVLNLKDRQVRTLTVRE
ncbi:MAG: redoxin domain-containing protein [Armatimonadetes bacterium]|nr:redoxin domain-containing protein [Armatimonadota bacterium]MDW8120740.1 alkyl hydroperoxide reductase [Armatimonadota bacterium]